MDESTGNTGDEERVIDLEFDRVLEGLLLVRQHLVEPLGLRYRARKSVEYKAGEGSSVRAATGKRKVVK